MNVDQGKALIQTWIRSRMSSEKQVTHLKKARTSRAVKKTLTAKFPGVLTSPLMLLIVFSC